MATRKITKIFAKGISHSANIRSLGSVKYIVIHYTGNKGDTARANCNYFRCSNTAYAGAHFFVDRTGKICESVKLKYPAWSVGGGWMGSGKAGEGKLWKNVQIITRFQLNYVTLLQRIHRRGKLLLSNG